MCLYYNNKQVKRLIATCGEYWIPTTINYISLEKANKLSSVQKVISSQKTFPCGKEDHINENRNGKQLSSSHKHCFVLQMQNNINAHNHVRHAPKIQETGKFSQQYLRKFQGNETSCVRERAGSPEFHDSCTSKYFNECEAKTLLGVGKRNSKTAIKNLLNLNEENFFKNKFKQ
uniref:Uncharacterized protein n=1 Tax=Glossina austeni TaxID=7395 RepID=A0A1A9UI86_GLOAU